jgi:hypothetical protein
MQILTKDDFSEEQQKAAEAIILGFPLRRSRRVPAGRPFKVSIYKVKEQKFVISYLREKDFEKYRLYFINEEKQYDINGHIMVINIEEEFKYNLEIFYDSNY